MACLMLYTCRIVGPWVQLHPVLVHHGYHLPVKQSYETPTPSERMEPQRNWKFTDTPPVAPKALGDLGSQCFPDPISRHSPLLQSNHFAPHSHGSLNFRGVLLSAWKPHLSSQMDGWMALSDLLILRRFPWPQD